MRNEYFSNRGDRALHRLAGVALHRFDAGSLMDLPTLLALITDAWPQRYERGRVVSVALNRLILPDGSAINLRVLVQTIADPPPEPSDRA